MPLGGFNAFYSYQIFDLDSVVVDAKMFFINIISTMFWQYVKKNKFLKMHVKVILLGNVQIVYITCGCTPLRAS